MAFFKNLLHPLHAQDTTHLNDGEIQLLLRQYQWGSAYVGGLPSYFFKIVDAREMRKELGHCDRGRIRRSPIRATSAIAFIVSIAGTTTPSRRRG